MTGYYMVSPAGRSFSPFYNKGRKKALIRERFLLFFSRSTFLLQS